MSVRGPDGTLHPADSLRALEHQSIRDFVQRAANEGFLRGRVLDYGCGLQPYRSIVEDSGGEYEGYDLQAYGGNVSGENIGEDLLWDANAWDAILCTQVVQYVAPGYEIIDMLSEIYDRLVKDGFLVMTYPTNWPEVESSDLHRFTKAGMERLLNEVGFEIIRHERRAEVPIAVTGDLLALGYAVLARA